MRRVLSLSPLHSLMKCPDDLWTFFNSANQSSSRTKLQKFIYAKPLSIQTKPSVCDPSSTQTTKNYKTNQTFNHTSNPNLQPYFQTKLQCEPSSIPVFKINQDKPSTIHLNQTFNHTSKPNQCEPSSIPVLKKTKTNLQPYIQFLNLSQPTSLQTKPSLQYLYLLQLT